MDNHERLELLGRTVSDLEEQLKRLQEQLDSLSEHVEHRFQRHYQHVEDVDNDARNRDLEYQLDRVRSDIDDVRRTAESSSRGW